MHVNEIMEDSDNYYIVTEILEGGELFDRIIEVKKFNELNAAHILEQVLKAINYMHKKNLTHRDLKPENILLESKEMDKLDVKIADFGFSCIYDPEEGLDLVLGSPLYMAPEIIQNKVYNEKVDIWSIGVITYMLLSGSNPFPGQTKEKVKEMIVNSRELIERNLAGKRFQHVSANAKDFITKCLTKDANLRWSAEQLLSHKWMVEKMAETHEDIPEDVQKDIMNNLSQFSNATKF